MPTALFKCDYCGNVNKSSDFETISKHEGECGFNPANRACMTCTHSDYRLHCALAQELGAEEYSRHLDRSRAKCSLWEPRKEGQKAWQS